MSKLYDDDEICNICRCNDKDHFCEISKCCTECPGPACPYCLECHATPENPDPCKIPFDGEDVDIVTQEEIKQYYIQLKLWGEYKKEKNKN